MKTLSAFQTSWFALSSNRPVQKSFSRLNNWLSGCIQPNQMVGWFLQYEHKTFAQNQGVAVKLFVSRKVLKLLYSDPVIFCCCWNVQKVSFKLQNRSLKTTKKLDLEEKKKRFHSLRIVRHFLMNFWVSLAQDECGFCLLDHSNVSCQLAHCCAPHN